MRTQPRMTAAFIALLTATGISCHGASQLTTSAVTTTSTSSSGTSAATSEACTGLSTTTGLQVWLDASSLSVGDGGSVGTWNDCANSALAASQSTSTAQPVFSASGGPDNKPYVSFNGTSQYLRVSGSQVSFTDSFTAIILASFPSFTANTWHYLISESSNMVDGFEVPFYGSGIMPMVGGSSSGGSVMPTPDTWTLITIAASSQLAHLYMDGEPLGVNTTGTMTATTADLLLFAKSSFGSSANSFTSGKLAEVLMYNTGLSDADRIAAECYLSAKYSLGLPLCD